MLSKNDESHIVCLVVYEVAIYLTFVDDITIEVCFMFFKLKHHFPIRKHNLMWICNHPYYQPNLHHNMHTFMCFHK